MTYYARNLPHWHPSGRLIFLTWRLFGTLPSRIGELSAVQSPGKRFLKYDRALDSAKAGPLWLKDTRIAECVIDTLQEAQAQGMFQLHAYAVMANHVHILLEPSTQIPQITQRIKGRTALHANRILDRTGSRFWQDESFDHWIRDPAEFTRVRAYIEQNPVTAGLVNRPEDWPWSSASHPLK